MATTFFLNHKERRQGMRPVALRFATAEGSAVRFFRPVTANTKLVSTCEKTTASALFFSTSEGRKETR
jgi:hypothetical protein